MTDKLSHLLDNLLSFHITADLLSRDFVQQALLAAALLALVAGLIGPFIVMRQMSFAVHGSSELSLTGASFALAGGFNVGIGALVGCGLAAIPSASSVSAPVSVTRPSAWCWPSAWAWPFCSSTSTRGAAGPVSRC